MEATWRRSSGDEGRARPVDCALSAPLQSPCTLQGPGDTRRRLCADMPRISHNRVMPHHEEIKSCVSLFISKSAESRTDREDAVDF